ncbi:PREDICTED: putative late blight resistance protein homolog R1A-10 [Ipomoea nil]|uniref:putative late blight resistance protein homolog R1A-10 n=1 Tax=Ipomoea nil TaxID=35883 RepID=UPI000901CF2D|nr:PREDICTED: putative late blight resistance protein homolog R1A-10 [Ipomoea nil]
MAYAAVTSLMETLSLHFLQSQPRLPIEDLEAQMRIGNENLGLLQQIVEAQMREMELDEEASPKSLRIKLQQQQLAESSSSQNERIINAWDSILLTSRLREIEVGEVKQKIVSLHQNLGLLQQSLEKSEIPYHDAGKIKDLEAEIRDASFKVEERIEMELTAIYLANDSLHVTASLLRLHPIFNEAEKQTDYQRNELIRIQTEYQQLAKAASSRNQTLTDVSLLENGGGLSQPDLAHKNIIVSKFFKNTSKLDIRMVGCQEEFKTIFGRIRRRGHGLLQLVKGSSLHDLVHKKNIVSYFSKKPSKFDSGMVGCEKLFEKILDQLLTQQTTKGRQVVSIVGMGGIGKTTLAHKLYEHPSITSYFDMRAWVTEQRYLIVIDDIWNTTAWDSVQRCFPDDNNGSRILLTSRLREVTEYASSSNSPLNMSFLDADESWNLYCKVFGKTEFLLVFDQIGRDIVKKCKGLPLAITIVASLLSKIEEEEEKWKNVAKSVMGDSSDACSRILYLSYNQLPHHLKACFLYFGIFKEDYEISVKKLVRLWAAEGFLSMVKNVNLEKVAMECLQDLVDRSLVIVSKQSYNGEMKRIRIHDMLRDLCLREARLENLLNVNGVKKPCRWINHASVSYYCKRFRFVDEPFHKSHSFHLNHHFYGFKNADMKCLFSDLKLLRVLNMRKRFWEGVINLKVLENLVHLRYLALYANGYCSVNPNHFGHWNNMQTFIVIGDDVQMFSFKPTGFWKMPLLRNVCIERIQSLETPSVVYRNLENISWLDSKLCTKDLFTMIPNLKTLGVNGRYYDNNQDWFYNFVHLEQLEKLSIRTWMDLNLVMCSFPWATSLPNLKKLSLLKSNMQWSELSAISVLPNLEVLKLIHACEGLEWETSDGGFHRLKRLVIKSRSLQYWNTVGDHFPILHCLEISECYGLKEIPSGFADVITLALIQLSKCSNSLVASAKWIQEEQYNNYGNAVLIRSENIKSYWCEWSEEEESDNEGQYLASDELKWSLRAIRSQKSDGCMPSSSESIIFEIALSCKN